MAVEDTGRLNAADATASEESSVVTVTDTATRCAKKIVMDSGSTRLNIALLVTGKGAYSAHAATVTAK
jgi:predicted flavoprotein YhiN